MEKTFFSVFYSCHVFLFLTFFIFSTFFIFFKNVHWKSYQKLQERHFWNQNHRNKLIGHSNGTLLSQSKYITEKILSSTIISWSSAIVLRPHCRIEIKWSFYAWKQLLLSAYLSHRNSVCPSVCLSVRLSHGWISQKWCKLGSPNLHHRVPGRL